MKIRKLSEDLMYSQKNLNNILVVLRVPGLQVLALSFSIQWVSFQVPVFSVIVLNRIRNLKFARNLQFATSKTLVNFMNKMMFLSKNWYFSVQKALIYYTFNKSHHNSFILLVFSHVANFRYVVNFRFLTLIPKSSVVDSSHRFFAGKTGKCGEGQ